jgi:hypothetical protein
VKKILFKDIQFLNQTEDIVVILVIGHLDEDHPMSITSKFELIWLKKIKMEKKLTDDGWQTMGKLALEMVHPQFLVGCMSLDL